jgi:hypothetical protein
MHDHGNETLKVVALTPICCKSHKHTCKSLRASLEPAKDLNRESPSKKLECNRAWKEFGRETSLPTDDTSLYEITALEWESRILQRKYTWSS